MPTLHIKPKRHECSVNGCRNHDSYLVSKSPEHINALYLCGADIINAFVLLAEHLAEHEDKQADYYDLLHDPRTLAAITALYGVKEEPEEHIETSGYADTLNPVDVADMQSITTVSAPQEPVKIEPKPRPTYPPRRTRK